VLVFDNSDEFFVAVLGTARKKF